MKCPKCQYLGFETADRCKNCGYDFSLLASGLAEPELPLRLPDHHRTGTEWRGSMHAAPASAGPAAQASPPVLQDPLADLPLTVPLPESAAAALASPVRRRTATATLTPPATQPAGLPLFSPVNDDDRPLVTLPVAPRPPLSVRRTPDTPHLRARTQTDVRTVDAPLVFTDESGDTEAAPVAAVMRSARVGRAAPRLAHPSSAGRRVIAAAIDHLLLASVDALVVYFTLRMASLELSEWRLLPLAPVAFFLCLITLAYFGAFTAVGGQTIGKMATRIRVVSEDLSQLNPSQTVGRTLAGALTVLTCGIGFLPAIFGERRAMHDRLARTRVIRLDPV